MYRIGIKVKRFLLVTGDFLIFFCSLFIALSLRYGTISSGIWDAHIVPFFIISIAWLITFYISGLYDLSLTTDSFRFLRTFLESMLINLGLALAFFYLVPFFGIAPRTNLMLDFVLVLLLGYTWRMLFNRILAPSLFRDRVLFIGHPDDAMRVNELFKQSALGFELVAVAETAPGTHTEDGDITWHVSLDVIDQLLRDKNINTIVLGHKPEDIPGLRDALYKTLFTNVTILDRTTLEEILTGRVPLEHVSQSWFLEHLRENDKTWYEGVKRISDVVLSIPIGLFTVLTFPILALLVKWSSTGPILIRQTRIGKHGKPFTLLKYRTMVADAEAKGRPQFATEDDPRITKIGKILRKTRFDELPQIWNVLRGDMSLIGPRPERPEFVEELTRQMPFYPLRHLTRPGLSGWAQVKFKYASTFEDNLKKLQYDLYYIKHRSIILDLAILLKTVGIVVRREGT